MSVNSTHIAVTVNRLDRLIVRGWLPLTCPQPVRESQILFPERPVLLAVKAAISAQLQVGTPVWRIRGRERRGPPGRECAAKSLVICR
jgi:hypothetical protein